MSIGRWSPDQDEEAHVTKAVDPFEEFLRKKKVEQLQQKLMEGADPAASPSDEALVLSEEDPAVAERVKEEMEEFFDAGGNAGAELFSKVGSDISGEKVEEIRDALEEVFQAPPPAPAQTRPNEAFVDFFKSIQESFEANAPLAPEEPAAETAAPEPAPLVLENDASPARPEPRPDPDRKTHALDLAEILSKPTEPQQLAQRVDLVCRLIAKLVERAQIPESEIIEVLIKSGVEF